MDQRFKVAQYGQDSILDQLFYPRGDETHEGVFIEVGAGDGVTISNTYYLEKVRDWRGLLVEPIPTLAEAATHNRWSPVWSGCVVDREEIINFSWVKGYSESMSGVHEQFHPSHLQRVKREIIQHSQQVEELTLPGKTINGLMDTYNLPRADILSLDVQSLELSVLKAYDVKTHPIKAILLDTNGFHKQEVDDWFRDNGYILHWKHQVCDEYLYVHPELKWSWVD